MVHAIMFSGIKANIAQERASLAREMEYMRQNVADAAIQESVLIYESCNGGRGLCLESEIVPPSEEQEIRKAIARIPETDDSEEDVKRILASKKPELSLDEVMGISSEDEENPTEIAYNAMTRELHSGPDEDCDVSLW